MTRKVILVLLQAGSGGQAGLGCEAGSRFRPGRISLPPPRAVPQPVFNRHQIDLRPVPQNNSQADPRGSPQHGHHAYRHLSGIPAWRDGHLPVLRHGHHAHRCLSGIPAWRRSHLSGLWHRTQPYRCFRAIPAWRSDTKPIPNRSMNGVNGWLRHGVPAPRHLRGWFCAMNRDLESSVSGKGSSYGSED